MSYSKTNVATFPDVLAYPLRLIPDRMHNLVFIAALNKLLSNEILEGEMDFLINRSMAITVRDIGITIRISFNGKRLIVADDMDNELIIQGCLYDFMSLISRQSDPDTLVFQRRLVMQGDTELGLAVKNFLDAIDTSSSSFLSRIEQLTTKALPLYQRFFNQA